MELFDTTVTEELFELTRDGYTYSVDVEANYHVYDDRLGTKENSWDCEVKNFELTKEEEKKLLNYLICKAADEFQFD